MRGIIEVSSDLYIKQRERDCWSLHSKFGELGLDKRNGVVDIDISEISTLIEKLKEIENETDSTQS